MNDPKLSVWMLLAAAALAALLVACPAFAQKQKMFVPAYFVPGPIWSKMDGGAPTVGLAILNPASGPGSAESDSFAQEAKAAQKAGIVVIGYVDTGYGKRPIAAVEREATLYYSWYHVDGIFYDEVSNTDDMLPYYTSCYSYAKSLAPKVLVAINPGTQTTEGYMAVCDIVCNFESKFDEYETEYDAPDWVAHYPASRFCHIIYDVPSVQDMQMVVEQSKARHAGWVYVTNLSDPNPYYDLPPPPYWTAELAALAAPH